MAAGAGDAASGLKVLKGTKVSARYASRRNVYPMDSTPRGYCLIINNVEFDPRKVKNDRDQIIDFKPETRFGSDVDEAKLKSLFDQLGYVVDPTESNLTSEQMLLAIERFAKDIKHAAVDSCVVVILTHGNKGDLLYTKDSHVDFVEQILPLFNGLSAVYLSGKPKVFIVQACRGDESQEPLGVSVSSGKPSTGCGDDKLAQDAAFSYIAKHRMPQKKKRPNVGDIIVCRASVSGFASMRSKKLGTWFIRKLVTEFAQNASCLHMHELMTRVHRQVFELKGRQERMCADGASFEKFLVAQVPELESSLMTRLFFNPPLEIGPVGLGTALAYWHWIGYPAVIKDDFVREMKTWKDKENLDHVILKQIIVYSQSCLGKTQENRHVSDEFEKFKKAAHLFHVVKDMAGMKGRKYGVTVWPVKADKKKFFVAVDYPTAIQAIPVYTNNVRQQLGEAAAFHKTMQDIVKQEGADSVPFVLLPYDDERETLRAVLKEACKQFEKPNFVVGSCLRGPDTGWDFPGWVTESDDSYLNPTAQMPVGFLIAERYAGLYFHHYSINLQQRLNQFKRPGAQQNVDSDSDDDDDEDELMETDDKGIKFTINKLLVLLPSSCNVLDSLESVAGIEVIGNTDTLQGDSGKISLSDKQRYVGHSTVYKLDDDYFIAEFATPLRFLRYMRDHGMIDDSLLNAFYEQFYIRLESLLDENTIWEKNFQVINYDDARTTLVAELRSIFEAQRSCMGEVE